MPPAAEQPFGEEQDQDFPQPQVRLTQVRALGIVGAILALATMGAAFGVAFQAFFSTTLLSAGLIWAAWPILFSPDFTQWVFGAPKPAFWKMFLLFVVAASALRLLGVRRK